MVGYRNQCFDIRGGCWCSGNIRDRRWWVKRFRTRLKKPIDIIEYTGFARTIDPRIETQCLACPPDEGERDYACSWEFTIK